MKPTRSIIVFALVGLLSAAPVGATVLYTGLDEAQEVNARALMPLAAADCDTPRWRVERMYRDSEQNLGRALQALGYYTPKVIRSLSWGDDCWQARFEVEPGPPVTLAQVEVLIEGAAQQDPGVRPDAMSDRPRQGDVLHHGRYETFKNTLLSAVLARGYFDAEFSRKDIVVDRAAQTADLALHLNSGPRYTYGAIQFTEGIIREDILHNYTDIQSGAPYLAEQLSELMQSLNSSGYFESVNINTEPADSENKSVPVIVELTPGTRRAYSVGLGFATDTGPQGRLDFANRRVNDRGHQLESRLFGSALKTEFTSSYRWPKRDPRKEWYSLVAGFQREETDTSDSDTFKLGLRRTFKRSESWLETRYLEYATENYRVGSQDTSSELVIAGTNWEYTRGRELSRTLNGQRYNFDVRGASDALGSDTSFLQLKVTGKWIHSFSPKTRVLARARIGTTLKDDLAQLPVSIRFFAGGDNSVRGYGFETLGPLDVNGAVVGGSHLAEVSVELERMVYDQWAIAAFADTGSAFNGSEPEFSSAVGFGVRWYSPVGPVRLDFAHPLDDPGRSFRIHLSLGLDL